MKNRSESDLRMMGSNPVGLSEFFSGLSLQLLKLLHNYEGHSPAFLVTDLQTTFSVEYEP